MKKHKITILFLLFISLVVLSSFILPTIEKEQKYAKQLKYDKVSQNYVFWFFLRIQVDARKKEFRISGPASRATSGTVRDFEKSLWNGISHRQIAIGPFTNYDEAENARLLYQRNKEKVMFRKSENAPEELNWFLITFRYLKRARAYRLEPMPARLATGSANNFVDALYEGLAFSNLVIGPFWDYQAAEEAKKMYRKNE